MYTQPLPPALCREVVSDKPSVFTKTISFKYSKKKSNRNISISFQSTSIVLRDKVQGRQYHLHLKIILPTSINYTQCRSTRPYKNQNFILPLKTESFYHQPTWVNKKNDIFYPFYLKWIKKGRSTQYQHSSAHTNFPKEK